MMRRNTAKPAPVKDKKSNLAKNYFFNVAYKILNIAMPLITAPYLSRTVGAEGVGTYAYYYAIAHYFYIFGKMGLNNYGAREIAMSKDDQKKKNYVFSSIYYQQFLIVSIVMLLYAIFCFVNLQDGVITPLILGLYTIGCLFDIDWLYTGGEKFVVIAVKNIIVKVVSLVAIFIFVKSPDDLWLYTLIMSLSMLIGFITLWFGLKREATFVKVKFKDVIKHIKPNIILLFPVLAANIYHYVDKIMVGDMVSMKELGYYDNAEKIVYGINGFITAFTTIMMPKCSKLIAEKKDNICKERIGYVIGFLFILILLMGSICYGVSDMIVPIVFGTAFMKSIPLLQLLLLTLPFMIWAEVIRAMWVIPSKKDRVFLVTLSSSAVLNFFFNLMFIPKWGAAGACLGTIIAEMFVPITQYIFLRKDLKYARLIKDNAFFIIPAIVTMIILKLIQPLFSTGILNLLLLVSIGFAVYALITLVILAIFRKRDLAKATGYIKRNLAKH